MMSALKMTAERIALCGVLRRMTLSTFMAGYATANIAGRIAKYFATSLAIENVVSAPRVIKQLLADFDDFDQFGGIGIEVHHVGGLFGGLRSRVHRHADVGLRERGRVVGAVAGHRDEATRSSARA